MDRVRNAVLDGTVTGPTPTMVWGRSVVLGSVASAAGVVSHAAAGGNLPGPLGLFAVTLSCVLGAAVLLTRRARASTLALAVLAGQTWVHGILSAVSGHRGDPTIDVTSLPSPAPVPVQGAGTLLEQYRDAYSGVSPSPHPGQDWFLHQVDHFVGQGPLMLLAHLGGALAVGLFLAVGEEALWAMLALAQVRAAAQRRHQLLRSTARAAAVGSAGCRLHLGEPRLDRLVTPQVLARSSLRHRGPPFVLAA